MIQIIDNFFDDQTCDQLRQYMLDAKNFDEVYHDYAAINFYDQSPEVSFIQNKVHELKNFTYLRSWSFIYKNFSRGVLPHADPSTYTLSVWVTPDESILDWRENGLNIYMVKPIADNDTNYTNGHEYIYSIIKDVNPVKIPYRYNRAILFDSRYIHSSDNVSMKSGLENRRVSYTYLFG
jgi:hypothetical protein